MRHTEKYINSIQRLSWQDAQHHEMSEVGLGEWMSGGDLAGYEVVSITPLFAGANFAYVLVTMKKVKPEVWEETD